MSLPIRRTQAAPWLKDSLWRRAQAVPSLDLRFADNKSLVDSVSGQNLITFTRASLATYFDSTGTVQTAATDVPRFDHNPTTGESLGLLVEEQRTNLLLRSDQFDNASWGKAFGAITANNATAPDGTSAADTFIPTALTGLAYFQQNPTVVASSTYTWSVYLKASGYTWVFLDFYDGANHRSFFNLTGSGTVGTVEAGNTSTITAVGNGWYRCTLTRASANTSLFCAVAVTDADNSIPATYNGTSGINAWGAQLEAGAFATSYIPTTSAAATRAADVATITGITVAPGCIFAQFSSPASGSRGIVSINDNTANNRIELRTSGTDPFLTVVNGGATQADVDAGTIAANLTAKLAGRVATDNFGASASGGTEVLDSSGIVPSITQLQIGRDQAGNYLTGRLARLALWSLPDTTLQRLTQ